VLAAHRQRLILDRLRRTGSVAISAIADELDVSRETVRRDISALARRNELTKTHGGAVSLAAIEPELAERRTVNLAGKREIGRLAARLVSDGAAIILDCGSTTQCVAEALMERRNLTVYTNDLAICRRLSRRNDNRVLLLGGELQARDDATIGWDAVAMMSQYHADIAFVGAGGITPVGQLTDYTRAGAELRARMLISARIATVVADHTKFARTTPVRVPNFDKATYLIADRRPDAALRRALTRQGIKLMVPGRR
jgi:DeoR family glycerol-3-phosphate regulon repressor